MAVEFVGELQIRDVYPSSTGLFDCNKNMVYYGNSLYVAGRNTGAILRVNANDLTVDYRKDFSPLDISSFKQITIRDGIIYALVKRQNYKGYWIQKLSTAFSLIDPPLYCGMVRVGTDGNLFGATIGMNSNSSWEPNYRPISGQIWSLGWELLPNDYPYFVYPCGVANNQLREFGVAPGSNLIDFEFMSDGSIVTNMGPSSSFLESAPCLFHMQPNGVFLARLTGNSGIGPNEICVNGSYLNKYVIFRCTSAFGNLRMIYIGGPTVQDYGPWTSQLLDPDGSLYDGSIYHQRSFWYTGDQDVSSNNVPPAEEPMIWSTDQNLWSAGNSVKHEPCGHWHKRRPESPSIIGDTNLIFTAHNTWPSGWGRIVSFTPGGELIAQYAPSLYNSSASSLSSFVVLGGRVYLWQASRHTHWSEAGHKHLRSIITLDANTLIPLSLDDCMGGYVPLLKSYEEDGRCIVSDGVQYLYNFHISRGTDYAVTGSITKYKTV